MTSLLPLPSLIVGRCAFTNDGAPGVSRSEKDSIKRGVFLNRLRSNSPDVKAAWTEQQWWYGSWLNGTVKDAHPRKILVVIVSDSLQKTLENYGVWMFMDDNTSMEGRGGNLLSSPALDSSQTTYKLLVKRGWATVQVISLWDY